MHVCAIVRFSFSPFSLFTVARKLESKHVQLALKSCIKALGNENGGAVQCFVIWN